MPTIYVNSAYPENGIYWGLADDIDVVKNALDEMFGSVVANELVSPVGIYKNKFFVDKFCQFVVIFTSFDNPGILLELADFNDTDTALDYYIQLKSLNWDKGTLDKIISLAYEIKQTINLDKATLVEVF